MSMRVRLTFPDSIQQEIHRDGLWGLHLWWGSLQTGRGWGSVLFARGWGFP